MLHILAKESTLIVLLNTNNNNNNNNNKSYTALYPVRKASLEKKSSHPHKYRVWKLQTRSLRGWELFTYDLQKWHWAKCLPHFVFYICLPVHHFVEGKICRKCAHCFVQSILKKRSFLINKMDEYYKNTWTLEHIQHTHTKKYIKTTSKQIAHMKH